MELALKVAEFSAHLGLSHFILAYAHWSVRRKIIQMEYRWSFCGCEKSSNRLMGDIEHSVMASGFHLSDEHGDFAVASRRTRFRVGKRGGRGTYKLACTPEGSWALPPDQRHYYDCFSVSAVCNNIYLTTLSYPNLPTTYPPFWPTIFLPYSLCNPLHLWYLTPHERTEVARALERLQPDRLLALRMSWDWSTKHIRYFDRDIMNGLPYCLYGSVSLRRRASDAFYIEQIPLSSHRQWEGPHSGHGCMCTHRFYPSEGILPQTVCSSLEFVSPTQVHQLRWDRQSVRAENVGYQSASIFTHCNIWVRIDLNNLGIVGLFDLRMSVVNQH